LLALHEPLHVRVGPCLAQPTLLAARRCLKRPHLNNDDDDDDDGGNSGAMEVTRYVGDDDNEGDSIVMIMTRVTVES
jgi:hypothetical protein